MTDTDAISAPADIF